MAFTVEDGSGLATANAYISEAEFTAHHGDRNVTLDALWTGVVLQGAIVEATDYADKRFGRRFRGWKNTQTQALEWPRNDAYDDDDHAFGAVPRKLKMAIAEYTLLVLQLARNLAPLPGPGFPIVDPVTGGVATTPGGTITETKEKVGPIETVVKMGDSNSPMTSTGNSIQNIPEYPQADLWMEELLQDRSSRELRRG